MAFNNWSPNSFSDMKWLAELQIHQSKWFPPRNVPKGDRRISVSPVLSPPSGGLWPFGQRSFHIKNKHQLLWNTDSSSSLPLPYTERCHEDWWHHEPKKKSDQANGQKNALLLVIRTLTWPRKAPQETRAVLPTLLWAFLFHAQPPLAQTAPWSNSLCLAAEKEQCLVKRLIVLHVWADSTFLLQELYSQHAPISVRGFLAPLDWDMGLR